MGRVALAPPGAMGRPAMASMLAGTPPGQVAEPCTTGTLKLLLDNVAVMSVKGPVTAPDRGMVRGPMVHDTPNRAPVLPLTVAFKVTFKPFTDVPQLNPPVMVPGLAAN